MTENLEEVQRLALIVAREMAYAWPRATSDVRERVHLGMIVSDLDCGGESMEVELGLRR